MKSNLIKILAITMVTVTPFEVQASPGVIISILIKAYEAYKALSKITDLTKFLPSDKPLQEAIAAQTNDDEKPVNTENGKLNYKQNSQNSFTYHKEHWQENRDAMNAWLNPQTKEQLAYDRTPAGIKATQDKYAADYVQYVKDFKVYVHDTIDLLGKPISELNLACALDKSNPAHNLHAVCGASTIKSNYSGVLSYQATHPESAEDVKLCVWGLGKQPWNEESLATKKEQLTHCDKIFDKIVLDYKAEHKDNMTDFKLNKLEIKDVAYYLDPHVKWKD
jgi:hypothetical protein